MKKKTYREDLNRHIPQKINEFASLALAGRYPYLKDKCQIAHHHNKCVSEPISGPHSQVLAPYRRVGGDPLEKGCLFPFQINIIRLPPPPQKKKICPLTKKKFTSVAVFLPVSIQMCW